MMKKILTEKDNDTYRFIIDYIKENGYAPSYQEIAEAFGFKSTSTAYKRIQENRGEYTETNFSRNSQSIKILKEMIIIVMIWQLNCMKNMAMRFLTIYLIIFNSTKISIML